MPQQSLHVLQAFFGQKDVFEMKVIMAGVCSPEDQEQTGGALGGGGEWGKGGDGGEGLACSTLLCNPQGAVWGVGQPGLPGSHCWSLHVEGLQVSSWLRRNLVILRWKQRSVLGGNLGLLLCTLTA